MKSKYHLDRRLTLLVVRPPNRTGHAPLDAPITISLETRLFVKSSGCLLRAIELDYSFFLRNPLDTFINLLIILLSNCSSGWFADLFISIITLQVATCSSSFVYVVSLFGRCVFRILRYSLMIALSTLVLERWQAVWTNCRLSLLFSIFINSGTFPAIILGMMWSTCTPSNQFVASRLLIMLMVLIFSCSLAIWWLALVSKSAKRFLVLSIFKTVLLWGTALSEDILSRIVSILLLLKFNSKSHLIKVLSQIGQLCFCLNSSVLWISFRYLPINKALFTYGVGFTSIELSVSSLTGTRYLHILEMSSLVKFSTSIDVFLIVPGFSVLSLDMVGDCSHTLYVSDFLW